MAYGLAPLGVLRELALGVAVGPTDAGALGHGDGPQPRRCDGVPEGEVTPAPEDNERCDPTLLRQQHPDPTDRVCASQAI